MNPTKVMLRLGGWEYSGQRRGSLQLTEADYNGQDNKSVGHRDERRHKGVDDKLQ